MTFWVWHCCEATASFFYGQIVRVAPLRDEKKLHLTWGKPVRKNKRRLPQAKTAKEYHTDIITKTTSLNNAIEAEERTPSLLIVPRAEQRLALAHQLLRRRAPRVVFRKRNRVDRHAPTCAVQADLDA